MKSVRRAISLLPILSFVFAVSAGAQQSPRSDEPPPPAPARNAPEWGTTDRVLYHVDASEFSPRTSATTYGQSLGRYSVNPDGVFIAALHLPSGAFLTYLELDYCDMVSGPEIFLALDACPFLGGSCITHSLIASNNGQSGCSYVTSDLSGQGIVINNNSHFYRLEAITMAAGTDNQIVGAYVGYKLQVSPAPLTATFPNDVPTTHQFFRFVEALARSGITAGCGGGNYCVDSPITRGEMAVFLSVALGLHFPN